MAARTGATAIPVHHTEVDGIPCVWADLPGELDATLTFRVGAADESLATRGITHMFEHLATPPDDWTSYDTHATVTGLTTTFVVRGDPEHVVAGLANLASRIVDVDLDRLPHERRILIAEAWSPGTMPTLTRIRYGARGAGLEGYEEFGVRRVSAEELREWALRFSAGNAMLWLTGAPPVDLRCPLVDGPRLPCPTLEHRDLPLPMLASGDDCTWGLSFLAPPTTVADGPATEILRERLLRLLRTRHGITYSIERRTETLAPQVDHSYVGGDVLLGYEELALKLVLDELAELAENGPSDEEVEIAKIWSRRYAGSELSLDGWMADWIDSVLIGRPAPTIAEWLDDVERLTPEAVAATIGELRPTLLVSSSSQADPEQLGLRQFDPTEEEPLAGTVFLPLPQARWPSVRLVVGSDGISYSSDGSTTTYAVDAVEVMTQSGTDRTLIRTDGTSLVLAQEDWADGQALWSLLDDVVPRDRVVDLDIQGPEEPFLRTG